MNTHLHPSRRTLVAVIVVLAISAMGGLSATLAHAQTSVVVAENGAGNGAISTFTLGGGSTPTRRITGPLTGLASPAQIAVDRSGNYYVANTGSSSITVYGPTATGNVAPLRTIAGPATGLNGVFGVAVDATGRVYASNHYAGTITEYAANASGNAAPVATIAGPATGLAVPFGLALDPAGHLWVVNASALVSEYAVGAKGNVAPIATLGGLASGINSAVTVAFDSAGHLFVNSNRPVLGVGTQNAVEEFAPGATGDPSPIAVLQGADSGLHGPLGLGIVPGATEQLLVSNEFNGSLTEYPVPADGDLRPAATPVPVGGLSAPLGLLVIAPPTLTSPSALHGTAGLAFSQTLTAGGGFGPYTWALTSGALPLGLTLNPATGAITGTPKIAGTSSFTVRATDQSLPTAQTATATISVTIGPAIQPAVYVANGGNGTVTSYAVGASGNLSPLTTFGRLSFGLDGPAGIAIAPSGRVYVANSGNDSVTQYAPGAAAGPLTTPLAGSSTGLQAPSAVALDAAGDLYVADQPANAITVYAPGAGGNAAPIATIAGPDTGLSSPRALTVDSAGRLWVANSAANSLTQYAAGANGDARPATTIAGSATGLNSPAGLTRDPAGDLLVTNQYGHSVTVYAPGANGNAFPKATLAGTASMLSYPTGIDVDTQGRLYVANQYDSDIHVYAPGAAGDTAPIATIAGPATGLSGPDALAVTPPLSILTPHLRPAIVGHRYRLRLRAGEGRTPYRWSIVRGSLPAGLRLAPSGIISGRARRTGVARLRIRVRDAEHPAAHAVSRFTLVVRRARHHAPARPA
jgi:6-phosphogluconolactonase (cycloisomerase 2 family)